MNRSSFNNACLQIGISLNSQQLDAFEAFEGAMYEWNQTKNLTRISKDECWLLHFIDSLLVAKVMMDNCPGVVKVLDIGTGPGFPAWPLACAFPQFEVTAIDSNGKMLEYLRSQPLNNLTIHQVRAEEWYQVDEFDVVTGRALAPLGVQLEVSTPFVKKEGFIVPMRTPNDDLPRESSLKKLRLEQVGIETLELPGRNIQRVFPIYRRVLPLSEITRRKWAEIKKSPVC